MRDLRKRDVLQRCISGTSRLSGVLRAVDIPGRNLHAGSMQEPTYGQRLAAARRIAGYRTQQALADVIGVSSKTIRNYESGRTSPDAGTKELLRRAIGDFDAPGDEVERAVRRSELQDWRQGAVISEYQRHLHEQRREATG